MVPATVRTARATHRHATKIFFVISICFLSCRFCFLCHRRGAEVIRKFPLSANFSHLSVSSAAALSSDGPACPAARLPGFILDGMFTHFAVSDRTLEEEDGFTAEQYARFTAAVKGFENAGLKPKICHCCNSAALCLDKEKHLDMCRPGIILYGLTPAYGLKLKEDFMPVMTVKSVVSMVKKIKKGTTVSYGRTFKAPYDMTVATVTAGYADGYPRLLSSKGQVIIHGRRANIIGRICMDQMSVDISGIENVKQGDEVILFGKELPVEELAEKCGTINYEIVCDITNRVPRISV